MPERGGVGVILLQLGTPDAPTPAALRRYLGEFLADRRVVDVPRVLWWPILHGIVLRTRPRQSARLYQKVWTPGGSPLAVTSQAQATALAERLTAAARRPVRVVVGMRYGEPSIRTALAALIGDGVDRILAFPMYPQYAGATTGSSLQRLFEEAEDLRVVPSVRVVPPYFEDAGYIGALAAVARESLAGAAEPPTRIVLSFHGLPERYADAGDPYPEHCRATASRIERAVEVPGASFVLAFQSRFGREPWLQPYTDRTLEALGREGARVAVMCPGFTADCLETLEEIGIRGAEQFHHAGGRSYHRIACLNTHPAWLDAMAALATRELGGWI
jgi:protoporphyrin/coproporphyrin ferrochelatase